MKPIILALFLLSPLFCYANSYDDDEKIRRAAQQIADEDQRQRDAARQRADDAERANQPSDGGAGNLLCIGLVIGVPAVMLFLKYQK
jgi:hypothetical protein